MKKYIEQLLIDLENAKSRKPPKPNLKALYPDHPALEYGLDYIAEWEMSPEVPMAELFGLEANQFPPVAKLTEQQMVKLVDKILELWAVFNFGAAIPAGVPVDKVYAALIRFWEENAVSYLSDGFGEFEFCEYEEATCPWGSDHCTCKDLEDDYEKFKEEYDKTDRDPNALPF